MDLKKVKPSKNVEYSPVPLPMDNWLMDQPTSWHKLSPNEEEYVKEGRATTRDMYYAKAIQYHMGRSMLNKDNVSPPDPLSHFIRHLARLPQINK